ncbi:VWA domain-containing protein [Desulfonatronum sp. SC1]|nr:VWA domain-containing protein [Desulfonatronum sp. SC1]
MQKSPIFILLFSIFFLLTLALNAPTFAQLSELEGTHGHVPSSLDALEGDVGHAPAPESAPASAAVPVGGQTVAQDVIWDVSCPGNGVCLENETQLPLRVLPRPFAHIYSQTKADSAAIASANVPAFHPLYVFARQNVDLSNPAEPKGWYQVGPTKDAPSGWMQAQDVMEWRQALVVSYTHPGGLLEGRNPVLMFRDLSTLQGLIDSFDRADQAREFYKKIATGDTPDEIVSMEPKRFVDITQQFYILPILQFEQTQIMGDDVRLLQLAAAVPGARGADTLADTEYREQAQTERGETAGASIEDLKVDIVFTIDTTRSMQPFIDMTKEAVTKMVSTFTEDSAERFRFGLVGFRDCTKTIPLIEYISRNFTPQLVDGGELIRLLDTEFVATEVGSLDYAEEVFAGVDTAIRSNWREGALRFMILIGDASSHPKGHPQNTLGKDEVDLRREADDAQVHILSIHLQDPRAVEDHPIAIPQFMKLSQVRGSEQSAFTEVSAFEEAEYQKLVDSIVGSINDNLSAVIGQAGGTQAAQEPPAPAVSDVEQQGREAVAKVWEAALVEYIGKSANPPKDIVAWVVDRDLVYTTDRSLEVRVLVTRDQLSSLAQALDSVVQALMRAEVTQVQFFESLQNVAGQTMKRPEDIGQAATLADTGLLPAFISSLPYRSDILSLTDEMFASMTAEQRAQLEWNILAKLEQYRTINEQVDAWFRLNETDADTDMIYPLHLDYLP